MFNPSQQDVRRFFCAVHAKRKQGLPLSPLEDLAASWLIEHPEFDEVLGDEQSALERRFDGSDGRTNPFLHLSMHLAISEQVSIDQPPGIGHHFDRLMVRFGSRHEAAHQVMECLGEILWNAERSGGAPDGEAYLECLARRSSPVAPGR
jgi:hypothetical protein